MQAEERRRQIAALTAVEGRVSVAELAERFDVTAETIRRDLAALNDEGVVQRVHGGAVASQGYMTSEFPLAARLRSALDAKEAIARAAAAFLPSEPGKSIFLDSGTTISALAQRIAFLPEASSWSIVTNSLPAALELAEAGVGDVQLLGGTVRAIAQAVVGDTALRTLALLRADVAFVGTNALTVDHGLSTADAHEAAVKAAMVTNARRVVVLCDSTKLGNDYLVSFAPLDAVDVVVTDWGAPQSLVADLERHGVNVVIADSL
ncbi:DeoR/GlpR family DNA-binding transcription regulator [Corynebacterium sp. Q4381]|uniref:DeoR/GlpR family DNA-binding transcription regulator n=1 Tax=Corynebacterium sp. Marseille-Q4381 TaxID=3121597 RepID=UPI002FE63933